MKGFCMWALAGALTLMGCQEAPKGYVINGVVDGMADGKIYLKAFRNKMFFDVDSAEVRGGKFTFEGAVDQPLLFGLATEEMRSPAQLFVENARMSVRLNEDGEIAESQGSPVNDVFQSNAEKVFEEGYDIDSLVTKYPDSPAAAFYRRHHRQAGARANRPGGAGLLPAGHGGRDGRPLLVPGQVRAAGLLGLVVPALPPREPQRGEGFPGV